MTLSERIKALQAQRLKAIDASKVLSDLAMTEDRTFTEEEGKTFNGHLNSIKDIDKNIDQLMEQERLMAIRAVPVPTPSNPAPTPGLEIKAYKPFKGQGFVRLALAISRAKGNYAMAANIADDLWKDQTPEVATILHAIANSGQMPGDVYRAAVAAGTTTNATWAGPLIYAENLTSEFIELLRARTFLGLLPLRAAPFNVSIPRQTGGVSAGWVGEGQSKPVAALSFDRLPIPWAKTAVITVITQELARHSSPSAEMLVRDDLIAAIATFLDKQFIDPTVAAVANVNPASILNGVTAIPSTGATVAAINTDLTQALKVLATANMPMLSPRWLMTPSARITLQNLRTTQEQYAFPEVNQMMLKGYPIVESNNVPTDTVPNPDTTILALVDCSEIFHASDPVVDISTSTEASLQMDSAPATPPTTMASMFQQNMMAIKAEQFQYWVKRHAGCATYISGFQV
jgi:HK97 family phage major capsid protein